MFFGNLTLVLALFSAIFSAIFFLRGANSDQKALAYGKKTYYAFLFFTTIATLYLFCLFLAHRFEFSYVYSYSSFDLPFFYLLSSLWAGQEGTFLLWLFIGAILGVYLIKNSGEYKGLSLFFYLLVQIFLLILLLKKSPFELLLEFPQEGRGLNPLLEDFWMVIHPPLVFIGYAALAIPFCFALASLVKNNYKDWTKYALPWGAFGCFFLGAGIFVGGYWAYKVLGWGGYWGWDPVENASLIPWLFSVAFLHGVLVERRDGSLPKTNLFLAIIAFLLIIYGTFLTRSGVLADFSVHSFTDLGINLYLVIWMVLFVSISLGLLLFRGGSIKANPVNMNLSSQSFFVLLGIIFLSVTGFLILFGTSAPLITKLFGQAAKVHNIYYIRTNLPLAIFIALILGIIPLLFWKNSDWLKIRKKIYLPLGLSILFGIIAFLSGVRNWIYLLLALVSFGAFFSNLLVFIQKIKGKMISWGSYLTHVGFGALLLGILFSSAYSSSRKVNLPLEEKKIAYGLELTYKGSNKTFYDEGNFLIIQAQKGSENFVAKPKFYYSEYSRGIMRSPHIKYGLTDDLYLAPLEIQEGEEEFEIAKGDSLEVKGYKLKFISFDMKPHQAGRNVAVGAILEFEKDRIIETVTPSLIMGGAEEKEEQVEAKLKDGTLVYLEKVDADSKSVLLRIVGTGEQGKEILILEISKKPLILLVWLGTAIIMIGIFITTLRRAKEIKSQR
jgi:cytochrome c-type biogenesis protein CcmF